MPLNVHIGRISRFVTSEQWAELAEYARRTPSASFGWAIMAAIRKYSLLLLQRKLRHTSPRPRVLFLQRFQPSRLLKLQAAILAPVVGAPFGNAGLAAGLLGRVVVGNCHFDLSQDRDNLPGLCFFRAIFQILSYQTLSRYTWYKIRRSREC